MVDEGRMPASSTIRRHHLTCLHLVPHVFEQGSLDLALISAEASSRIPAGGKPAPVNGRWNALLRCGLS